MNLEGDYIETLLHVSLKTDLSFLDDKNYYILTFCVNIAILPLLK